MSTDPARTHRAAARVVLGLALGLAGSIVLAVPAPAGAAAAPQQARCFGEAATIVGTPGDDVIRGTDGPDVIISGRGDDTIDGRGGDDLICGRSGDDTIRGGGGDDRVLGWRGSDRVTGGAGDDRLLGGPQADHLAGGSGDDLLDGGPAEDECDGQAGTNTLLHCEVTPNGPPAAVADVTTTGEDAAVTVPVLTNDTDPDGDPLKVTAVGTAGTRGAVSISAGGAAVSYDPRGRFDALAAGASGTDSFTYTVADGQGGSDVATVTVTVTGNDDAPVAVADSATVPEDAAATTIDVLADDTDVDGGPRTIVSVTQPAHGAVTVTNSGADLSYTPNPDYCNTPPPSDDFTYTLNGGSSATVRVSVTCVNDAPVVDLNGASGGGTDATAAFTEDAGPVAVAPVAEVTDADGGQLAAATVTLTNRPDGALEWLLADTTGTAITATYTPGTGVLSLTGADSVAHYQQVVRSVSYVDTSDTPDLTDRVVTVRVNDGTVDSNLPHSTVSVTAHNDAPTATDQSVSTAEDTAKPVTLAGTDPENDSLSFTAGAAGHGTVSGSAPSVTYTPDPDYCGPDSFTFTVDDGHGGTDSGTVSVTVTCVDDAPVVDLDTGAAGNGSAVTFNETDPHTGNGVLIAPNAAVTDVDDTAIESATVTLGNRPDGDANESLVFTNQNGISGSYNSATGVLTLTGAATKAQYAAAIAGIRYDNTVNPPDATDRTITVTVNDGDVDSAAATATVHVVRLNAPPVNTVPGPQTTSEDTPLTFGSGSISVTDPDNTSLTVQVQVTHGTFAVSTVPAGLTVNGNGTGTVTATGPVTAINTALDGSSYTPATDYNGPAQLTLTSTDSLTASDVDTVAITVTAVNDAPTASNLSAAETYTEDTPLDLVDIVISDIDSTTVTATLTLNNPAAGSLSTDTSGTVTSTYTAGTGVWTATGPIADVNALLAGVTFTPAPNFNAGFTIATKVGDGIAADVTGSKTMTGTPVDDAPTLSAPSAVSTNEDTTFAFTAGNALSVADIDDTNLSVTLTVAHGSLTMSILTGLTFTTGDGSADATMTFSGSKAALDNALASLTYTPATNYNGSDTLAASTTDGPLSDSRNVAITVVPVNDAPVADDEAFSGAGNRAIGNTVLVGNDPTDGAPAATGPSRTISANILAGDTDVDGPLALQVQPGTFATNDGGSVTVQSDGDFVYKPKTGTSCSDTSDFFDYVVTDGNTPTAGTDTGRVTIEIAECVWYVDGSLGANGDGSSGSPFNAITSLNGAGGSGDADDASDYLFLYGGSSFGGGLPLESGQRLLGQPNGLTVDGTALVAPGSTNPAIANAGGNALTLSSGNTIQGINLGATPAGNASLSGSGVGTATMNTVAPGSITNPTGGAVDLSNGTLSMAFTSITSSGATNDGIRLDNAAGTFTGSGGSLQNAGSQDVDLSGDNTGDTVDFTYDGTITDDVGQLVSIANQNNGTKDFNGLITDGNDGDGAGISLSSNAVATTRFDGGLVLSTGANPAFSVTGGGTVVVNEPNGVDNSLTTTTGTALNVANTWIGTDGLNFTSISANGAPNGIVLNATGPSGGLTVTGNGGTCTAANQSGCSGGEIKNTAGADSSGSTPPGTGIVLKDTVAPSLTRMWLHDNSNYAIRGTNVAGFALDSSVINGTNGSNGTDPFNDSSVYITNLSGSATVSSSDIRGGYENNFSVVNSSGSLDRITFTSDTFGDNNATNGNDAVQLESTSGASALKATIQNSVFTAAEGDLVNYSHDGSGAGDLVLTGNSFSNNHPGIATGGGGVSLSNTGTSGNTTMTISNNTFRDAVGHGVLIVKTTGPSTQTGTFTNNTIGISGVPNSGSAEGSALKLQTVGQGTMSWSVTNNSIYGYNNNGIEVEAGGGASAQGGSVSTTITGNTVAEPGTTAGTVSVPKNGLHFNIGTVPGDSYQACAVIGGAGALANAISTSGKDGVPATVGDIDFRLRQRQATTFRLPGYGGANNDNTAVQNFVAGNNGANGGSVGLAGNTVPTGGGFTGGAPSTCP